MQILLNETFQNTSFDHRLQWFCEPVSWQVDATSGNLVIATEASTDFWQRTHYGFQADNGHLLYLPVTGDCVVETWATVGGLHQYDQAGLMLRDDADNWLKTSVEFEPDSPNRLGAVVTRDGYSDWSTQDLADTVTEIGLRAKVEGDCVIVEAALAPEQWTQIRVAYLRRGANRQVGLYACSPKEAGFAPRFSYLRITTE